MSIPQIPNDQNVPEMNRGTQKKLTGREKDVGLEGLWFRVSP
jgi:hypothetical protein